MRIADGVNVKPFSKVILCGQGEWERIALDSYELERLVPNVVYRDSNVSAFDLILTSSGV